MQSSIRSFKRGLCLKSHWVLVFASLVILAGLGSLEWCARGTCYTHIPEELVLVRPNDDHTHLSYQLREFRRGTRTRTIPGVFLVGGSSLRECTHSTRSLARDIALAGGRSVETFNFATAGQNLGESMAIVDQLEVGSGTVVIGISPRRLNIELNRIIELYRNRRLMLVSPSFDSFLRERDMDGIWDGFLLPGVFNFASRYLWNRRQSLKAGELREIPFRTIPRFKSKRMKPRELKEKLIEKQIQKNWTGIEDKLEMSLGLLRALIAAALSRNLSVILLEHPINPSVRKRLRPIYSGYQESVRLLARDLEIPYWEFMWKLDLRSSDFFDVTHLVESGRDIFQPVFAHALGAFNTGLGLAKVDL